VPPAIPKIPVTIPITIATTTSPEYEPNEDEWDLACFTSDPLPVVNVPTLPAITTERVRPLSPLPVVTIPPPPELPANIPVHVIASPVPVASKPPSKLVKKLKLQ